MPHTDPPVRKTGIPIQYVIAVISIGAALGMAISAGKQAGALGVGVGLGVGGILGVGNAWGVLSAFAAFQVWYLRCEEQKRSMSWPNRLGVTLVLAAMIWVLLSSVLATFLTTWIVGELIV